MSLQNRSDRRLGRLRLLAAGLSLLVLAACTPGGPEDATDTDLVVTVQVPESDYNNLQRYYLDPEVYDLTPPGETSDPIPQETKDRILDNLRANMEAARFLEVAEDADPPPDVTLVAGAVLSDVWFYYYGWGGYYSPGWYYPPYYQVGSFEVGSVVWQMFDLRSNPPADDPKPIWIAGLNGVLSNSGSTNTSRLQTNMSQAFTQSPYIQATPATR